MYWFEIKPMKRGDSDIFKDQKLLQMSVAKFVLLPKDPMLYVVYLERAENSKTEEYLLTIKGSKVESLKGESLKVKSLMDQSKLMKALNVNGSKFKFQKMKSYHISSTIFSIQSQEIQTQDCLKTISANGFSQTKNCPKSFSTIEGWNIF